MARQARLSTGDLERLSAYIDRQLGPRQRAEFEARLSAEPELAQALLDLEGVVAAVGSLEPVRIPRSFTLTPDMAGARRPARSYPLLQFATAISALTFVALIGIDLFGLRVTSGQLAAPAIEQLFFESAPIMADEIQEGDSAAQFAAGEPATDAQLDEASPITPGVMLEEELPVEAEAVAPEGAMKSSSTPLPTSVGEDRAAVPEPERFEQSAPELGAAGVELESDLAAATSASAEFRSTENSTPGIKPLLLGEILSGALAILLGLLLLIRRRRPA